MRKALVLGITADLDFAAGAFLAGFMRHNPDFAGAVIVLHDGLSVAAQAALSALAPKVEFRPFGPEQARARLAAAGLDAGGIDSALARCHPMTLAKFEMFDWFGQFDTLVWCDVDMLVLAPVADLWQAAPLGWRGLPARALDRRAAVMRAMADHSGTTAVPVPNGGVVVAGAALRARWGVGAKDLYALTADLITRTEAETLDELALFFLASRQGIPVQSLDLALNHPAGQPGSAQARILHAIGPDKFWTATPLWHACPEWRENHAAWVAAGGRPGPAPGRLASVHPLAPDAALAFARNRAYWQSLWPDLGPALPRGLWPDLRTDRAFLRFHLNGGGRAAWLELTRTASDKRLRAGIGVERARLPDPGLTERIEAALPADPGLRLQRHDGRRLTVWTTEIALAETSETLHRLRDLLLAASDGW